MVLNLQFWVQNQNFVKVWPLILGGGGGGRCTMEDGNQRLYGDPACPISVYLLSLFKGVNSNQQESELVLSWAL